MTGVITNALKRKSFYGTRSKYMKRSKTIIGKDVITSPLPEETLLFTERQLIPSLGINTVTNVVTNAPVLGCLHRVDRYTRTSRISNATDATTRVQDTELLRRTKSEFTIRSRIGSVMRVITNDPPQEVLHGITNVFMTTLATENVTCILRMVTYFKNFPTII